MTLALTGHGVARGIAIGRCHLVERNELDIGEYRIGADRRRAGNSALPQRDRSCTRAAGRPVRPGHPERRHSGAGEIIQTHVLMLGDSSLRDGTEQHIRSELCNAEWALQMQLEQVLAEFRSLDDAYIRSRGEDVAQVVRLVQNKLNEEAADKPFENMPDRLAETLVISAELTPGELAILQERGVGGIVTEHGGPHSHTAILASSLGIPAVMGVRRAQTLLREGETLVLDGGLGVVYADPDEAIRDHYHQVQRDYPSLQEVPRSDPGPAGHQSRWTAPSACRPTRSGRPNCNRRETRAPDGIGLYRTEFLYLQGAPPDEESQLAEFAAALERLDGLPLTIRTLDLGADKSTDYLDFAQLRRCANPALGLRAVRLCLRDTDLFKTQLRAILRASALGPVRCLIPMLTSVQEIRMVHVLLDEAKEDLEARA